ncbi:hypothetical protein ACFQU2_37045 [Siccirubricoccus deserti]
MVERTLEPHAVPEGSGVVGRVAADGPPVRLAPNTTVTLNLALHELATNAAKYGALSAPGGRVEVAWTLERAGKRGAPPWSRSSGASAADRRCGRPSTVASARRYWSAA